MESDINQQQEIDAYIEGHLSADQKQAFETRLQRDPRLAEAVRFERFLRKGVQIKTLKDKFQELHKSLHHQNDEGEEAFPTKVRKAGVFKVNKPVDTRWWQYAAAACVVGVLAGIGYYYIQDQGSNSPQLANQTSKQLDVALGQPQEGSSKPTAEESVISANTLPIERQSRDFFNDQEQGQLLSERRENIDFSISEEDRKNLFIRYFVVDTILSPASAAEIQYNAGINALRRQEPREATEAFHGVVTQTEGALRQKAQWYVGLAYLQSGNLIEALRIMTLIKQTEGHIFQKKAEILYQRLN